MCNKWKCLKPAYTFAKRFFLVRTNFIIWRRREKWIFNRKVIYFVSNFNHLMTIIQYLILRSRVLRAIYKTTDFRNFFWRKEQFKYSSSFNSVSRVVFVQWTRKRCWWYFNLNFFAFRTVLPFSWRKLCLSLFAFGKENHFSANMP